MNPLSRLDGPARDLVLRTVQRFPGLHEREIERRLGMANRLAAYHLESLEKEGAVRRVDDGGFHRYFHHGPGAPRWTARDVALICLLRRPPVFRIMTLLVGQGPLNHATISSTLGLPKASASYHLGALVQADHVTVHKDGRERWYRAGDLAHAQRVLAAFEPVPEEADAFAAMLDDLLR